jgi:tRNA(Ile)-lysidine synthase TilS/MesJ
MDRTAEEIVFTDTGCNFCDVAREMEFDPGYYGENGWLDFLDVKNKYDCLIGLSGGVDSSYTLHLAVKQGLRPLCFSVDNGWQDEKAQENIMRLVEGLKVPYYRYNIDLKKFTELQGAFMKAGQKNIEIPTDHILMATTYEMADKYGIKTILSGGNWATESIMPESWGYQPRDLRHIKDIYKRMTGKRLKGLPVCGLLKFNYYRWVKRIKTVYLLDYIDYNREEAIKILEKEYGYQPYGEKHCESTFTWWFQNYYLFEKFGIDKRKAHLSSLIVSGQITREEALKELEKNPVYPELGIEERVMKYPRRDYKEFKTDERLFNFIGRMIKAWK